MGVGSWELGVGSWEIQQRGLEARKTVAGVEESECEQGTGPDNGNMKAPVGAIEQNNALNSHLTALPHRLQHEKS